MGIHKQIYYLFCNSKTVWRHVSVAFRVPMAAVQEILVKMVERVQNYVIPRALGTIAHVRSSLLVDTVR